MIGMYMQFNATVLHRAILAKSFDNRKQFFFNRSVVALSSVQLTRVKCNGMAVLHDDRTKLVVACVSIDVKRKIVVRITEQHIFGNQRFRGIERLLTSVGPNDLLGLAFRQLDKRSKNTRTTPKAVAIVVQGTKKRANLSKVARRRKSENSIDLLAPSFETDRR